MNLKFTNIFVALIISAIFMYSCDAILGSKSDGITDEIFEAGRQDPSVIVEEVGYVALLPFWEGFNKPTDIYVGYDELIYITDADGLHVLDRAGRRYGDVIPLRGAVSVTQDRLLNVYVAARMDTVVAALPSPRNTITWDLPVVYKIKNANGAGPVQIVQKLVHPFRQFDNSRSTSSTEYFRLDRTRVDNDELVEITGVSVLANNDIYVSRRGPRNQAGQAMAADNTVLTFTEQRDSQGKRLGTMQNTGQIRTLNPSTPSLLSALHLNDIQSFIGPPQRETMNPTQSFLIAQGNPNREIPFRVLWIEAVQTPDGLEYRSNGSLLARDTTRANSFLYDEFNFSNPTGIAFSADARGHIFVVDGDNHRLHMFQSNGIEGVNPPPGSTTNQKAINVSFGKVEVDDNGNTVINAQTKRPNYLPGNGPREFNSPSGVAYFSQSSGGRLRAIIFVADTGNNRISRFILNTDLE